VRDILFDNLPQFFKSRFYRFQQFQWNEYFRKNWIIVLLSILLGASSHILWDSFTHDSGYFVQLIPALQGSWKILDTQIPILKFLQHTSTILGGIVILISIIRLPKAEVKQEKINGKYWG